MHTYIKKALAIGLIVLVNIVFFQNCAKNNVSQQSTESSLASDTVTMQSEAKLKADPNTCPQYMPPICEKGQNLVSVKDNNGCIHPTCSGSPVISCPIYSAVACNEKSEVLKIKVDKEGCSFPVCEPKTQCPVSMPPQCDGKGDVLVSAVGADGCTIVSCKKMLPKPIACPLYAQELCEGGTSERIVGEDGCDRFICKPNKPKPPVVTCPQVMPALCEDGQLKSVVGKDGCKSVVCVKNPNPSCPQYSSPICAKNSKLKMVTDNYRCPVPVCQLQ